jgi:DNA topoisomerase-1
MQEENKVSAKRAGLRYVNSCSPGIRRRRSEDGFMYEMPDGTLVNDCAILDRIKALVIPPAWEEVWICLHTNGHLQATGIDKRGRKQYKYHPEWSSGRNETKFGRIPDFAAALPKIRGQVEHDLATYGITRRKVLAAVIDLLEKAHIRIGNDEYAREYHSYGLTTLRDRHVRISGDGIRIDYVGKKGVRHTIELHDRRLANIVKRCRDIPGQELFQYYDAEGERHDIHSEDVNEYIKEISGEDFTAKDFRTWAGSSLAFQLLSGRPQPQSESEAKKTIVEVIKQISGMLGNTPAICRKYYVHPRVLEFYSLGKLQEYKSSHPRKNLSAGECGFLRLLKMEGC